MKIKITVACILLLSAQAKAMTQNDFIERLKAVHPFFVHLNFDTHLQRISLTESATNTGWDLSVNTGFDRDRSGKEDDTSAGVSVSKSLPQTGGNISLGHTWSEHNADEDADATSHNNAFSLEYTHPLLQNLNGINDQLDYDLALIDQQVSDFDSLEQREDFLLTQLQKFVDLAYAQAQLKIDTQWLALAKTQLASVEKRFAASVADKVDVLSQKDAYHQAKQQHLHAKQDLDLLRHEMETTLDVEADTLTAELDLYQPYTKTMANLRDYVSQNSRALKIIDLERKTLKRQLLSDKNQNLAQLDLSFGLNSDGSDRNYRDSFSGQNVSWRVGLDLSYQLGGIHNSASIERTEVNLAQNAGKRAEQLLDIYTQAKVLLKSVTHAHARLASRAEKIDIAKARTEAEKHHYEYDNSQASVVISAQNNEQEAQLDYARVAADYQKIVLNYKAITDQLLLR